MFHSRDCSFAVVNGEGDSRSSAISQGNKTGVDGAFGEVCRGGAGWSRWRQAGFDTALAAVCWFWLGSEAVPPALRVSLAGGLFFVVWGIYYWDRRWDKGREPRRPGRQTGGGEVSLGAAVGLPGLLPAWEVVFQANEFSFMRLLACLGFCGVGTAVYYFLRTMNPQWLRGRPLYVAAIFWAGTMGLSRAWAGGWVVPVELGVFLIFWANARICLLPMNRKRQKGEAIVITAMLLTAAGLAASSLGGEPTLLAGTLLCSAVFLGVLQVMRSRISNKIMPALADGALWGPALAAVVFWS